MSSIEREAMNTKKVIHIANNFISSKVHRNLIVSLSRRFGVRQEVFIPVRTKEDVGINGNVDDESCEIKYSYCLRPFFRYFPLLKVLWVTINCMWCVGWGKQNDTNILVAHTLWSDGMVAFFIHLIKKRKYILIVRNTDINIFLPRLPHYRFLIKCSILRSKALIFISHAHKELFRCKYPSLFNAASVIQVIPNGLDDFWLSNIPHSNNRSVNKSNKKVIYVGRFNKNKNLPGIISAVEYARRVDSEIVLTLIGGSSGELKKLCQLKILPTWLVVIEHIHDKNRLLSLYRESTVFIMPSFHETFGLVYIEALSQGCSFIYTKKEGVDGYFDNDDFAVAVDPNNVKQISGAILSLIQHFPLGVPHEKSASILSSFSWKSIAATYQQLIAL